MSKYTTGELAKLCETTVRTVQYYDNQNLLNPSELTEGGRRLYSETDLQKMRLICTLRSLGLSLDTIKKIFKEKNSREVVMTFLDEQSRIISNEISELQNKQSRLKQIRQSVSSKQDFSVQIINDIAHTMENRKKLRKTFAILLVGGILMDIVQVGTVLWWIFKEDWIPFVIGLPFVILSTIILVRLYYRNAAYICPDCHTTFKPKMRNFFFASHNMKTRKLTCTSCGHKGYCIEIYDETVDRK